MGPSRTRGDVAVTSPPLPAGAAEALGGGVLAPTPAVGRSNDGRLVAIDATLLAIDVALAVVVASAIPIRLPLDQAWMAALLAMVFISQRIERRDGRLQRADKLIELPVVVALFWLSPWWIVVTNAVAGIASMQLLRVNWRWQLYSVTMRFATLVVLIRVVDAIDPASPLDGPRAIAAAVATWIISEASQAASGWVLTRAGLTTTSRPPWTGRTLDTLPLRALPAAFGLLIAMALAAAPWALAAVAALGYLFIAVGRSAARVQALETGISHISAFATTTSGATNPLAIQDELLDSIADFGGCRSYAVVRARQSEGDAEHASTETVPLQWTGVVDARLRQRFTTTAQLVAALDDEPTPAPDGSAAMRVWQLDDEPACFLAVEVLQRTDGSDAVWESLDHLARHATLAIAALHRSMRLVEAAEREYRRARTDPLTGLPNRFAAERAIVRQLADDRDEPLTVILTEAPHYKQLVDVLGQERGDRAVVTFAEGLARIEPVEMLAHVGPAKFLLLVRGDDSEAVALARQASARAGFETSDEALRATPAFAGVVTAPTDGSMTAHQLIGRARLALARSHHEHEVVVFADAQAERAERRMAIQLHLPDAIEHQLIVPYFQPQVDLRTGAPAGFEVLARWTDPELGFVSPGEFIQIAEESQHIERLTVSITLQALDAATRWASLMDGLPISVNLSGQSLARPWFVRTIVDIVQHHNRSAEMLTLEVTESTLANSPEALAAMERLRDLGVRISIDDFGTGYSTLGYLDRLPIHELKIDKSMVDPLATGGAPSPVLRRLIELCGDLGYSVVAEGIEEASQCEILRELGCDIGQGYLFARPMAPDDAAAWLDELRAKR